MTEAGVDWIAKHGKGHSPTIAELVAVEYWVRAFCDEVDHRAYKYDDPDAVWMAYEAVKRELLGGRDET